MEPEIFLYLGMMAALYFLPSVVAYNRKATARDSVLVVNAFLGWTFIGWVVALAMALGRTDPPNYYLNQPPV